MRAIEPISLTEKNWRAVESAYGHSLSPEVRRKITMVTNSFLRFAAAENTGLMSDAIERAARLRKNCQVLIFTINERALGDVTREYVDDELELSYARLNRGSLAKHKYVRELNAELERFLKACDLTLREFDHAASYSYWPDGGAWNGWIQHLIHHLETPGLPTGVSKDARSKKSPFVAFVSALQACIPREYARAQHSVGALAEAIHKARLGRKPSTEPRKARLRKSGLNTNA
jgi:hypothetical protein